MSRSQNQILSDFAQQAQLVLENPAFNEALRLMSEDAMAQMKRCPIRDREGLLLLAQAARITDKVAETLRGMLEAGKMAKAQIDIDNARNESGVKRALRKVLWAAPAYSGLRSDASLVCPLVSRGDGLDLKETSHAWTSRHGPGVNG